MNCARMKGMSKVTTAKLNQKQLLARDAKRKLGAELLQAVRDMKAGRSGARHKVKAPPVIEAG